MGSRGIIGWGNYTGNNQVNDFRLTDNGLINYWWANDLPATTGDLADGQWHHVACTYDGITRKIYVDGNCVGSDTPVGHNVIMVDFKIGCTCGAEYFQGAIDDLNIWNRALDPSEIKRLLLI